MPLSVSKQYSASLVQPAMDFECVMWGNCCRDLLVKVHKMMKMYARSILDIKNERQSSKLTVNYMHTIPKITTLCIY